MMNAGSILTILDRCCETFDFPMLDNGYVYLAATRLSLFRSDADWAMVIEVFGYSPRQGQPDTHISTFASRIHNRAQESDFASPKAFADYLANNPHNESYGVYPIANGDWLDAEDCESVAADAQQVLLRGKPVALPPREGYQEFGIELEEPDAICVFEACRYLAQVKRDLVLATDAERRRHVPPDLQPILLLDEWHHPDVVNDVRPSQSETFQQLAEVLANGEVDAYQPSSSANTHWSHWPDGGTL